MKAGELSPRPGEALSVWRRYMELPRYLRTVSGKRDLIATLEQLASSLGFERLAIASGATFTRGLAESLASELSQALGSPIAIAGNGVADVRALAAARELGQADALVAVGGGKTIDVAKSACELTDRPVIVVPTQLSADGIASPVSVLRTESGMLESRRARLPIALCVDLEVVGSASAERTRAGLGDLLANPGAVRDWRLAAAAGEEEVDDFAALLAQAAANVVVGTDVSALGEGRLETSFLERLLEGLVLSGLAMEIAGSSRPCSGAEHLISHALDVLHPGTADHGEQVAFGALVGARLRGEDWVALRDFMLSAGMKRSVGGFELSAEKLAEAVRTAPATRPGRYTVLDEVDLSERAIVPIVREVTCE